MGTNEQTILRLNRLCLQFRSIATNAKYMASWGLKCATLSSHTKVN